MEGEERVIHGQSNVDSGFSEQRDSTNEDVSTDLMAQIE